MSKPTKLNEAELEGAIMRGQSMAKAADWRAALKDQCPLNQDELAAFILAEVRPLFDKSEAELYAKDAAIASWRVQVEAADELLARQREEIEAKDAEIARLRSENRRLREALEPFAAALESIGRLPDREFIYEMHDFTAAEIRAAAKALEGK